MISGEDPCTWQDAKLQELKEVHDLLGSMKYSCWVGGESGFKSSGVLQSNWVSSPSSAQGAGLSWPAQQWGAAVRRRGRWSEPDPRCSNLRSAAAAK